MSSRLGRLVGIRSKALKRASTASAATTIVTSIRAQIRSVNAQP
jgi:hypothetical protein